MGELKLELRNVIFFEYVRQADFAEAIGAPESKISSVLHGRKKLSPDEADLWAKKLNCDKKILEPVTK